MRKLENSKINIENIKKNLTKNVEKPLRGQFGNLMGILWNSKNSVENSDKNSIKQSYILVKKLVKNSGFNLDTLHIYLALILNYGWQRGVYATEMSMAHKVIDWDEKYQYILKYFSPIIGLDFVEILGNLYKKELSLDKTNKKLVKIYKSVNPYQIDNIVQILKKYNNSLDEIKQKKNN